MSKIDDYLPILRKTFHINDEIVDTDTILNSDKPYLDKSLQHKVLLQPAWDQLLLDFKKLDLTGKVRDFTEGSWRHSFNCLLTFLDSSGQPSGIIFSVSIPFKKFGFYFYTYKKISSEKWITIESYEPLDKKMVDMVILISDMAKKHFNEFNSFEYENAGFKIEQIDIDDAILKNIDIWKVLFTNNTSIIM
jgi:hypothetical protein